jgi:hypothetical protein
VYTGSIPVLASIEFHSVRSTFSCLFPILAIRQ